MSTIRSLELHQKIIFTAPVKWSVLEKLLYLSTRIYIYIYIDESLLFCNCACSLEYSSLSTLAGLSYHIRGKLEVAFKDSPSSQHQHCTDEAQKAETVLSAVRDTYIYIVNFSRGTVLNTLKQSGINILRGKKDATTFSRQACFVNRFTDFDGTVTTKPT